MLTVFYTQPVVKKSYGVKGMLKEQDLISRESFFVERLLSNTGRERNSFMWSLAVPVRDCFSLQGFRFYLSLLQP